MEDHLVRNLIYGLMKDFAEMLVEGIKENPEQFAYTSACMAFIQLLEEKGISTNFNSFDEEIVNHVYSEITSFLTHSA